VNSKVNTPPYLVGFNLLPHCASATAPANCRTNGPTFYEIGTAAFLDAQNWNNAVQDASQTTGVFCDVFYHQQYFAQLAAYPFTAVYPNYSANNNVFNVNSTTSPLYVMYNQWDVNVSGYYASQSRTKPNVNAQGVAVCQS
jgi:hypothetical protein